MKKEINIEEIPVKLIDDNPYQPRKRYPVADIKLLARSISERGLMQAIVVIKVGKRYVIVAGHRRFRAFKRLRRKTISSNIRKESTKKDMALDLAMENAMRKDFTPAEKAESIFTIMCTIKNVENNLSRAYTLIGQSKNAKSRGIESIKFERSGIGFTHEDIHLCNKYLEMVGCSPNTANKYLRILGLPEEIKEKILQINSNESLSKRRIQQGYISVTMGYEISRIKSKESRIELYHKAIKHKWNSITLKVIIDELISSGKEEQINRFGSSCPKKPEDFGAGAISTRCLNLSSALWNLRNKIPIMKLTMDKLILHASVTKLKKACLELVERCDKLIGDDFIKETQKIKGNQVFWVEVSPNRRKSRVNPKRVRGGPSRFTIPRDIMKKMGFDNLEKTISLKLKVEEILV